MLFCLCHFLSKIQSTSLNPMWIVSSAPAAAAAQILQHLCSCYTFHWCDFKRVECWSQWTVCTSKILQTNSQRRQGLSRKSKLFRSPSGPGPASLPCFNWEEIPRPRAEKRDLLQKIHFSSFVITYQSSPNLPTASSKQTRRNKYPNLCGRRL